MKRKQDCWRMLPGLTLSAFTVFLAGCDVASPVYWAANAGGQLVLEAVGAAIKSDPTPTESVAAAPDRPDKTAPVAPSDAP